MHRKSGKRMELVKHIAKNRTRVGRMKDILRESMSCLEDMGTDITDGAYLQNCNKLKERFEKITKFESHLDWMSVLMDGIDDPKTLWKHDPELWHDMKFMIRLFHTKGLFADAEKLPPNDDWIRNAVQVFLDSKWCDIQHEDVVIEMIYALCCLLPFKDRTTDFVVSHLQAIRPDPIDLVPELSFDNGLVEEAPWFVEHSYNAILQSRFVPEFGISKADVLLHNQPRLIYYFASDARSDCMGMDHCNRTLRMREIAFEALDPTEYTQDTDISRYIGVQSAYCHDEPREKFYWAEGSKERFEDGSFGNSNSGDRH